MSGCKSGRCRCRSNNISCSTHCHPMRGTCSNGALPAENVSQLSEIDASIDTSEALITGRTRCRQTFGTVHKFGSGEPNHQQYHHLAGQQDDWPRAGDAEHTTCKHQWIACHRQHNLTWITKRTYYYDLLKKYKNYIRNTWKILKSIIGRENDKTSISEQFKCENIVTTDPQIISNEFCKYFSSVGNTFASAIPPPMQKFNYYLPNQKSMTQSIYFSPNDPTEILNTINSLKAKQSTGPDNISSYLIKKKKTPLSSPISLLINKSLEDGVVPDVFKTAKVIPIYKSLLCSLSKILEKIVHTTP